MQRRTITRKWPFMMDLRGKGAFIREYGREAWDRLPAYAIVKDGKRAYVTREAIDDNLWMANRLPDLTPA